MRNDGEARAQVGELELVDVLSVDDNAPRRGFNESEERQSEGRLAGTCRMKVSFELVAEKLPRLTSPSTDANLLPRSDLEADVLEHGRKFGRVGSGEALDLDAAVSRRPNGGRRDASLILLLELEV